MKFQHSKIIFFLSITLLFIYSCEEEEIISQQIGYSCVDNICQEVVNGGLYVSLSDCQAACENNNGGGVSVTYNCLNNSCVDPGDGSGIYSSLSNCENQCGNGSSVSFNCVNSSCVDPGDGSGLYLSLSDCENQCVNNPVISYNCINNSCIDPGDGTGNYLSLQQCEQECNNSSSCLISNFTVNSQSPYLLNGVAEIISFGNVWNSTYNYEIRLFTSNITGNANGPSYTGNGEMILFDLHTNGSPDGTYTFYPNTFPPNPPLNSCTPKYFLNQDMSIYSQGMAFPSSANNVNYLTIIDNGNNNYDIEFSFNTSSGTFTGCYSGDLFYWDTSGSSGSSGTNNINNKKKNPAAW